MAIYIDDRELVAAHQAGDTEAFDELVREHRPALLRHAHRRLQCNQAAEDAVQETLVRAFRALPKFNGEYRLGPWLHRIMSNVCIDEANRRRRDVEKVERISSTPPAQMNAPSAEEELNLQVDLSFVETAIEGLPQTHRDAFVYRVIDELEYDELATATGVSEANARARVSRARSMLRASLKGVAVLPALLYGMLKRGEKAAAAVTPTSEAVLATATGVTGTTALASTATQAAVTGVAAAPVIAGAAATAAPAAVPVVAKAAVSLGLAAAVFTPTSDSAVHQAAESLVSTVALVGDTELANDGQNDPSDPVVVAVDTNEGQSPANTETLPADQSQNINQGQRDTSATLETLSPSLPTAGASQSTDASPQIKVQASSSAALPASQPALDAEPGKAGTISGLALTISESGPGQTGLSGDVTISTDGTSFVGNLDPVSRIRLAAQTADNGGGKRLDGLLIINLNNGGPVEMRIAGFATGDDDDLQIHGLFRLDSSALNLAEQGNFNGSLNLGGGGSPGALGINFTP